MSHDRLDYMANQIGRFFASQKRAKAVDGIADHMTKFWDPRMRRAIVSRMEDGKAVLDPLVREAVERLKPQPPA
jgi:formate dehydrogenase subunit delta